VPPNVSHQAWETLLKKYVNDRGLVAYAGWEKNQTDLAALDSYLKQFAEKPKTPERLAGTLTASPSKAKANFASIEKENTVKIDFAFIVGSSQPC
jgi:hypothetical protein